MQSKRQKLTANSEQASRSSKQVATGGPVEAGNKEIGEERVDNSSTKTAATTAISATTNNNKSRQSKTTGQTSTTTSIVANNFGVDVDDLTDDSDSDGDDQDDIKNNAKKRNGSGGNTTSRKGNSSNNVANDAAAADDDDDDDQDDDDDDDQDDEDQDDDDDDDGIPGVSSISMTITSRSNHLDIQEQLAAAGPAGVAAAAAIATARKRKRPHSFETNPSVRKRQQTRLLRKLRACIDEYTMRVGQQAVVLITMPGKTVHNFKVFGAQPLENVIRACKHEIMSELEQALLEQAPQQFRDDANKHELPPLVIDGIPTPVEKMTQAQLRAFIPLMLKYSTGRGKPGWGKDTTRPPWWPETLPWANVRSDAREENEKQRISWTTTLRQIVTNCYKFHGRDDLLPVFDENEEALKQQQQQQQQRQEEEDELVRQRQHNARRGAVANASSSSLSVNSHRASSRHSRSSNSSSNNNNSIIINNMDNSNINNNNNNNNSNSASLSGAIYSATPTYASNFVHTITNSDGTVSLIQVDPANAQILTLPDGTQVRAVRLQTLGTDSLVCGQPITELHEASSLEINEALERQQQQHQDQQQQHQSSDQQQQQHQINVVGQQQMNIGEASLSNEGQIIVTSEDGIQSCYPMSSLVSIPASVYQQFASGAQQLSIMTADGTSIPANAVSIIQEPQELSEEQAREAAQQQQVLSAQEHQQQQQQSGNLMQAQQHQEMTKSPSQQSGGIKDETA